MKRLTRVGAIVGSALLLALTSLQLSACRSAPPGEAPEPEPVMAVTGAWVEAGPIGSEERLIGQTVAMRHLIVRAPAAGRVVGLTLQVGDIVRRGQIIGHILSREVEAAENGLAVAQQIDAQDAARLASSVKRYSHGPGIAVAASENGVVAQRMVTSGQMVAELDPLLDVIDPSSVVVNATVPSAELSLVRPGMTAQITSPVTPGEIYSAKVVAIAPSFDLNTDTSSARLEFTGGKLIDEAGAPADITLTTAYLRHALLIPFAALFQSATNGDYYVFFAGPDGRAHRQPVSIGLREKGLVQITKGLTAGQVVLTSGGYALADGLRIKVAMAAG
jgi:multidrug efflux pump subunit AcrA (membrane-fusion protein)